MKMNPSWLNLVPLLVGMSLGGGGVEDTKPEELFENFEDNIAMESERKYSSINFADFSNDPEFSKFLSIVGLGGKSSFGKKMKNPSSDQKNETKEERNPKPVTNTKEKKMADVNHRQYRKQIQTQLQQMCHGIRDKVDCPDNGKKNTLRKLSACCQSQSEGNLCRVKTTFT